LSIHLSNSLRFLEGFSASRYCRLALFISIYGLMPATSWRFLYHFRRDSVGSVGSASSKMRIIIEEG
jgi:hypothetical protein